MGEIALHPRGARPNLPHASKTQSLGISEVPLPGLGKQFSNNPFIGSKQSFFKQ